MAEHRLSDQDLKDLISSTVGETLLRLGVDKDNPLAMQKDFAFIRQWRSSTEAIRTKAVITLVGILITGLCGVLWVVLKKLPSA